MADKLFYFLAFVTVLSALMVVFSKNPVHSVLYLILTFFSISGQYVILNAQFLAVVNIIVYAGAIMVLFLFVIMFLNMRTAAEDARKRNALIQLAGVISSGLLLTVVISALVRVDMAAHVAPVKALNTQVGMVENLGIELFTNFLVPFELASVLFIAAMVGAVLLAKREEGERNAF